MPSTFWSITLIAGVFISLVEATAGDDPLRDMPQPAACVRMACYGVLMAWGLNAVGVA